MPKRVTETGYRYELYCLARNAQTTLCVVFCDTPEEVARKFNSEHEDNFPEELY